MPHFTMAMGRRRVWGKNKEPRLSAKLLQQCSWHSHILPLPPYGTYGTYGTAYGTVHTSVRCIYYFHLPETDCLRTQCHSPSAIQWRLYLSEVKSDLVRVWGLLVLFICLEPKLLFLYKRRHTGYVSYKMPVRDWKNTTDLSTVVNQFLNAVKA